jgi:hypothetical protein
MDERNHLHYTLDPPDGLSVSVVIPQEIIDRIKLDSADLKEDRMTGLLRSERTNGYLEAMEYCRRKVFELNMDMNTETFGQGRFRGHPYTVTMCRECPAIGFHTFEDTPFCKANNEDIPDIQRISPKCPLRITQVIEIKLSPDAVL